jgi:hypothetical protein
MGCWLPLAERGIDVGYNGAVTPKAPAEATVAGAMTT